MEFDPPHRFYGELAQWWPLISPVDDYREEAQHVGALLRALSRQTERVLELGSGGGHNATHLKETFELTLVDLSSDMLRVSRALNPECRHLKGDMRTLRLDEQFDAVMIHDAVDYMAEEADLKAALRTAFKHCRPGGHALIMPDHLRETFEPSTDHGGSDGEDGRGIRFLEWSWDPDPDDDWVLTEYTFVLRSAEGRVRTVHETHRTGVFAKEVWIRLMTDVGFEARAMREETEEDREPRTFFVGHKPDTGASR